MKKQTSILFCTLFLSLFIQAKDPFRIIFWNVENLFDCHHDTLKNDQEFLPHSMRRWHYGRYKKKLQDIARTIVAIGEWTPPALVGLCEVENNRVMNDLIRYSPLKESGYRYIITDSPDPRGIDVALLYQRDRFKLLTHHSIRIPVDPQKGRPTRDILHASGLILSGDTLDIFVCHFPSRAGNSKERELFRREVASRLKSYTDSLLSIRQTPYLILMGDFNDSPHSYTMQHSLQAKPPRQELIRDSLYTMMMQSFPGKNPGTYKYQGYWEIIDHFIVSGTLLTGEESVYTAPENVRICNLPFLLEKDEKYGGNKPFRTYHGMKYQGGYSDHLPIRMDIFLKRNE